MVRCYLGRRKSTLAIPNTEEFLKNKNISDRMYACILLKGNKEGIYTYIEKGSRYICNELQIDYYRTYKKRIAALVEGGYLENCGNRYRVSLRTSADYSKYIDREIVEKLYNTGLDNLIKVYVRLSWLYYLKKEEAWFTYNSLLDIIGYDHNKQTKNREKMRMMLEKLEELGLIQYEKMRDKRFSGMLKFRVLKI